MKDDDDEDQADGGLHQIEHDPALFHEQHVADEHADAGHAELGQDRHRHCRSFAAHVQPGFDALLVGFDVFLEFAREELAHLGIETVNVRDQREQPHQHQQQDG